MFGFKCEINYHIICIFYLALTASASISVIAPFFPTEAAKRGMSTSLSGAVFSVYGIMVVFGNFVTGKIIPIIGSKITLSLGILILGVSNIAFGLLEFIDSLTLFVALSFIVRCFEAIGFSLVTTTSCAIIVNSFKENSTKPISIEEVCSSVGYTIGPVIGSFLYAIGGYKLPFLFFGSAVLVTLPNSLFFIPKLKDISEKDEHSSPLTYLKLLSIPKVIVVCLVLVTASINFGVLSSTLGLHLQTFGIGPKSVGYFFLTVSFTYCVVGLIVGHFSNRSQSLYLFIVGLILNTIAFTLMGHSPFLSLIHSKPIMGILLFILGAGNGLAMIPTLPAMFGIVIDTGFKDDVTTNSLVSGLWTTFWSFESAFGPLLGGVFYQFFGFETLSTVIAGTNLLTAGVVCIQVLLSFYYGNKPKKQKCNNEEMEFGKSNFNTEETPKNRSETTDARTHL